MKHVTSGIAPSSVRGQNGTPTTFGIIPNSNSGTQTMVHGLRLIDHPMRSTYPMSVGSELQLMPILPPPTPNLNVGGDALEY